MARHCFLLQVRPELLASYRERHAAVWPEMLAALRESGWRNYSIFASPSGLVVGDVEADDFGAAQRAIADTEVNTRWQAEMAAYFTNQSGVITDVVNPVLPLQPPQLLDEIFNLDDQLAVHQTESG